MYMQNVHLILINIVAKARRYDHVSALLKDIMVYML